MSRSAQVYGGTSGGASLQFEDYLTPKSTLSTVNLKSTRVNRWTLTSLLAAERLFFTCLPVLSLLPEMQVMHHSYLTQ